MQGGFCLIEGVTENGRKFRPSDWVDRVACTLATFGPDRRLLFSNALRPVSYNGGKAILIDCSLQDSRPDVWEQVMGFARSNQLRLHFAVDKEEFLLAS